MAYISFAREERELFKLLFMRDRSQERVEENRTEIELLLALNLLAEQGSFLADGRAG